MTTVSQPWLLLLFALPARRASARVEVWRKLQRYGTLPLRGSGYLLPSSAEHRERLEWLAALVRKNGGEASVLEVGAVDDLPPAEIARQFTAARARDYEALAQEARRVLGTARGREAARARLRRRLADIVAIDFFNAPQRAAAEAAVHRGEIAPASARLSAKGATMRKQFRNRTWLTRPRPKIDRISSAWLIRRFIDPRARFAFATAPARASAAVPFDMYGDAGFGHRGDDCTFETLRKDFGIADAGVRVLAQIVHDADLHDDKYGRTEAVGINRVFEGWGKTKMADAEILRRGMELIEGLYLTLA